MNITSHFTLAELTKTELRQYDNMLPEALQGNLRQIAELLERIRTLLGGRPLMINSCYRSGEVNKAVGSKETSKHRQALAADFTCPSFGTPLQVIEEVAESSLRFDQLILEFYNPSTGAGWVHIGLGGKMRRQILTINKQGTFTGIQT